MKTKLFAITILISGCLLFAACGDAKKSENVAGGENNAESVDSAKLTKEGAELTGGGDRIRATKEGKPYTGEIWSDDEKTYVMEFKDGKSVKGTLFHKNGKPAMVEGEEGDKGCFDEEGNKMSAEEFTLKYIKYIEEAGPQIESVFNKMKDMK